MFQSSRGPKSTTRSAPPRTSGAFWLPVFCFWPPGLFSRITGMLWPFGIWSCLHSPSVSLYSYFANLTRTLDFVGHLRRCFLAWERRHWGVRHVKKHPSVHTCSALPEVKHLDRMRKNQTTYPGVLYMVVVFSRELGPSGDSCGFHFLSIEGFLTDSQLWGSVDGDWESCSLSRWRGSLRLSYRTSRMRRTGF